MSSTPRIARVRFEQAVYGSFPFWDRGYDLLAQSPGCRPEWLAEMRSACRLFGERPRGVVEVGGLFAIRLPRGPWMIVGPGAQGDDDRGRPGALAFHALFVAPRDFRKVGYSPFPFAEALRRTWSPEIRTLARVVLDVEPDRPPLSPTDVRIRRIAAALVRGRRVALEAPTPIDATAEAVWITLPLRVRRRLSLATWAFGNGNRFDLVALPRLAGLDLDASYLTPTEIDGPDPPSFHRARFLWSPPPLWGRVGVGGPTDQQDLPGVLERPITPHPNPPPQGGRERYRERPHNKRMGIARHWPWLGGAALLAAVLGLVIWTVGRSKEPAPAPSPSTVDSSYPDPSAYRDERPDPDDRARVAEGLLELAERFGVADPASATEDDTTALMLRLADRLRYRGPFLARDELARLASESRPERERALAWDAHVRRFAPDRPLPAGFERGPLRWRLDTLTWSFHLVPDPRRSPAEVPHALAHDLAVDGPIRPTPLADRYPALAAYARFLDRLPRR